MNTKKILSLLLALVMVVALLAGCGQTATPSNEGEEAPAEAKTLSVGYSPFNSKFSPFFSQTAYDQDAMAMTQLGLLASDRTGAIILKGIEGETINYNGTDYTYYGPADLTITENADGTVDYDFVLRDDLVFSDGEPLTVDDVIFSMYVLCDPTYDGSSTLYAQPIEGMEAYRSGMDTLLNLLYAAGRDNADFTYWTEEQQTAFWGKYDAATTALAQEIVDYCVGAGYAAEGDINAAASAWGFGGETIEEFAAALEAAYGADVAGMINTENAGSTVEDLFPGLDEYATTGVQTGESAASITGIQKTGDNSLRVHMTKVDATAIYQLGVSIAPLHYYGNKDLYDYDNNSFGFPKGDLSSVRAKTTQPMGAGPYKFIKFENGVINYEANENYFQGEPKTKYVNFVQCNSDDDKLNGIVTGTIDITDPTFSDKNITAIEQTNGGELTGDKITTNTVDNLGYGYIGQNAINVSVGGDGASEASKNLRKAFGTIFAVYRDVAIDSYYGDRASVINYPISNTSWAAPRPADDGYKVAFSVDVNGNDIYTSDMDAEAKYAAAKAAALGFFEAAGYTVQDGKVTAAPEGAKMEYTFWIPGDGTGDHPAFMIVTEAANALEELGIKLNIKDLTNSSDLWDNLDAIQVDMWAAAWGATVDPDMYQIYYSDVANAGTARDGQNPMGGAAQGGSNYEYCIADPELDKLIMDARATTNQEYRKAMYKACLDIVVDWAVETPTYQRQNAIIFSTERVNMATVTPDITTFYGWMSEIQNLEMN
ncbi:MAG: ABC transporter substrate-binding protein [Oscillospiraceae bacterium]|nr:ABC transporter substrate-binding protein [Oscillospiraceae bacterium]MBR0211940.1 ABC transporter substrate-binding protein [Oscillospiraceae bacterium]